MFLVSAPLAAALLVGTGTGPGGAPGTAAANTAAAPVPVVLARVDELYKRRDDKTSWQEQQRLVQSLLAHAPSDYEVLWRAARFYFWASDDPGVS